MSQAVRWPAMTREAFFLWVEARDERDEFDGAQPVAMTGGLMAHRLPEIDIAIAVDAVYDGLGLAEEA